LLRMRKSAIIGDKPRHIAPGIKLPFRSLGANHVIVLANVDRLKVSSFETDFLRGAILGENRCCAF